MPDEDSFGFENLMTSRAHTLQYTRGETVTQVSFNTCTSYVYFSWQPVDSYQYTLFQNGRHFSILLLTCKLALVASFLGKYSV